MVDIILMGEIRVIGTIATIVTILALLVAIPTSLSLFELELLKMVMIFNLHLLKLGFIA